jgi:two-component system, sensor histidine kinase and response regulator
MTDNAPIRAASILVAEDSEDQARLIVLILQRSAYRVQRVSSGAEAYAILTTRPPDLLITDVMMPDMTGFELLARLNKERSLPPTIVLTTKNDDEDVLRGFNNGALDYIVKPFNPTELLLRVRIALGKKRGALGG